MAAEASMFIAGADPEEIHIVRAGNGAHACAWLVILL
jgi:hypothetical protein